MKVENVPLEKIHIGTRYRTDDGDLESLAASIRDMGLLQPIGVDEYYHLIFGLRRLHACRDILEWTAIPCAILKMDSLIAGEYAENEFRKQFTASERTAIGKAIEDDIGRRKPGPKCGANAPQLAGGSYPGFDFKENQKFGRAADIAAQRVGFTDRRTFERAKTVTDRGVPKLIAAMDKGDISIDAASKIASQPEPEQNRILAMPKDERREVIRHIGKTKAEQEHDEKLDRDIRVYSELYESVQFLSRFYEDADEAWRGIARVNGFDFAELLHRAIQCLVRIEKGNPNEQRPGLVKKVL